MEDIQKHSAHVINYYKHNIEDYIKKETKLTLKDRLYNVKENAKDNIALYIIGGVFLGVSGLSFNFAYNEDQRLKEIKPFYGESKKIVQLYNTSQNSKYTSNLIGNSKLEGLILQVEDLLKKGAKIENGTKALKLKDELENTRKKLDKIDKDKLNLKFKKYEENLDNLYNLKPLKFLSGLGSFTTLFGGFFLLGGLYETARGGDRTNKKIYKNKFDENCQRFNESFVGEDIYSYLNSLVENDIKPKKLSRIVSSINIFQYRDEFQEDMEKISQNPQKNQEKINYWFS